MANALQNSTLKRALDVALSLAALPVAVPVMAVAAAAIRLESPGSPLFRQTRVGKDGRPFTMLKLRTMVDNAQNIGAGLYAEPGDPRFTRVGTFARRFSLDELPQIFNVLRGDMSIVGPRPMVDVTVREYGREYETILRVKPGLTGLSQVSGRNDLPRSRRLELDMEYARSWSLPLDLSIIARTFRVVLGGEGQRNVGTRQDVER